MYILVCLGRSYLNLPIKLNLNIIQKVQIQLLPNDISLSFLQEKSPTIIRLGDSLQELTRDIIRIIQGSTNRHCGAVTIAIVAMAMMAMMAASKTCGSGSGSGSGGPKGCSESKELHLHPHGKGNGVVGLYEESRVVRVRFSSNCKPLEELRAKASLLYIYTWSRTVNGHTDSHIPGYYPPPFILYP
jgi:hypothetical protein